MVDIYKILRRQRYELGGFSGVNMAEMAGNTANGLNQSKDPNDRGGQAYDMGVNTVSKIGPIGKVIGGAIKVGDAIGDPIRRKLEATDAQGNVKNKSGFTMGNSAGSFLNPAKSFSETMFSKEASKREKALALISGGVSGALFAGRRRREVEAKAKANLNSGLAEEQQQFQNIDNQNNNNMNFYANGGYRNYMTNRAMGNRRRYDNGGDIKVNEGQDLGTNTTYYNNGNRAIINRKDGMYDPNTGKKMKDYSKMSYADYAKMYSGKADAELGKKLLKQKYGEDVSEDMIGYYGRNRANDMSDDEFNRTYSNTDRGGSMDMYGKYNTDVRGNEGTQNQYNNGNVPSNDEQREYYRYAGNNSRGEADYTRNTRTGNITESPVNYRTGEYDSPNELSNRGKMFGFSSNQADYNEMFDNNNPDYQKVDRLPERKREVYATERGYNPVDGTEDNNVSGEYEVKYNMFGKPYVTQYAKDEVDGGYKGRSKRVWGRKNNEAILNDLRNNGGINYQTEDMNYKGDTPANADKKYKASRIQAYGGYQYANGGYNGVNEQVNYFGTGGSHEANMNGGIPYGRGASVEQGEVAYNSPKRGKYIFTNRF